MKILEIDDNNDLNDLMSLVIRDEGHDFTYTNNGPDGLKLIRENQYDGVFLDLAMPGFSGYQVIDELSSDGSIHKQPIIIFTATSLSDDELSNLKEKGIHSCTFKPCSLKEVREILNQLEQIQIKGR